MIDAQYFDGRSARAHAVRVGVLGEQLVVAEPGGMVLRRQLLARLVVQETQGQAPRRIDLGGGAALEVADHAGLAALLAPAGIRPSPVARALRSWRVAVLATLALLALAGTLFAWGLPWAARIATDALPASIDREFGARLWASLDGDMFKPSRVPEARQARIRERLQALAPAEAVPGGWTLHFRGGDLGANALAIPGGHVVVTDALIEAAGDDDEAILGVLAHELGHVAHRHALRQLVQGAAVATLVAVWAGDATTLLATVPTTLVTRKFARDLERDADEAALALLARGGLSPLPMADLLERLDRGGGAPTLLSTHPMTEERVRRLRGQHWPVRTPARQTSAQ